MQKRVVGLMKGCGSVENTLGEWIFCL
jgi:hypothetical protein